MRILVIRRDNIGDLVCTLPLIQRLRESFPQAWVGVLTSSYSAEILQGHPAIDAVFTYTKAKHLGHGESGWRAMLQRLQQLWTLRRQGVDLALLPASGAQASARRMARLVGAKRIVRQDDVLQPTSGRHEALRAAELLSALRLPVEPLPAAYIVPRADLLAAARTRLGAGPLLGLHISARKPSQRWPWERFAELIAMLHARHPQLRFALFWAPGSVDNKRHPGDDENARLLLQRCAELPVAAVPTASLAELVAGVAACDHFMCSDGGHMHVAAALGKPIVCFFGKSDAPRWHPWKVPYRLLQPESQEVRDISVAEAVDACESLMGKT